MNDFVSFACFYQFIGRAIASRFIFFVIEYIYKYIFYLIFLYTIGPFYKISFAFILKESIYFIFDTVNNKPYPGSINESSG